MTFKLSHLDKPLTESQKRIVSEVDRILYEVYGAGVFADPEYVRKLQVMFRPGELIGRKVVRIPVSE